MQCPECTAINRAGANFCDTCGCTLQLLDETLRANTCSPPPSEENIFTTDTALHGERKHVTILFSDLTGYTEMSEKLDPEEVKEITTLIFTEVTKIISIHGGQVSKYIGDAVMAVFGATRTHELDPIRAVKAATEIRRLVESYNDIYHFNLGHLLLMHSGINTGLVVTGETRLEKGFYGFVGDTINLASRLCSLANPNEILVGPETFRQTRGYFNFDTLKATKIKGKELPVSTYRVIAPREHPQEIKGVEGVKTGIIGRETELGTLQSTFRKAMADNVTGIVTVVGEAGIGKSRLLNEFKKWVESLSSDALVLRGRGTPENKNSANGLWKNLFTLRCGIQVRDGTTEVINKFRRNCATILPQEKADLVGHFVGFDFSSTPAVKNLSGSQAFEPMALAILSNYMRSITKAETVLLLDDIHLADAGSLDVLQRVIKSISKAPLMIVCMARPLLRKTYATWGEDIDGHQLLDLKPLTKRQSVRLINRLLKKASHIPDEIEKLITDSAEGNPFYIEELIKMLIEEGVITTGGSFWHIVHDKLNKLKIPGSLNGVLQARLDVLHPDHKRFLQKASVLGRLFWDVGVMHMIADDRDRLSLQEVNTILKTSVEQEIILEREGSQIEKSREFLFKHALLRDVAYETLLLKRRKIYHRQTAEWLTDKAGQRIDEYLHIIASHYELAGDHQRAVDYLERSAHMFFKINGYQEAISALERCLRLLSPDNRRRRAEIQVKIGEIYTDKGEYSRAKKHFTLALANEELLSSEDLATSLYRSSWIESKMGEFKKAVEYVDRGLIISRDRNDAFGIAQCLHTKGWVFFLVGAFDEAIQNAEQALALSRKINDKRSISLSLNVIQAAVDGKGQYGEALKINGECIGIGRDLGDQLIISRGLCNQGEHYRKQHNYREAAHCYRESLEIAREIEQKNLMCITLSNLGFALNQLESFDDARKCIRESLSLALEIEAHALTLAPLVVLAELYCLRKQYLQSAELIGLVRAHCMFTHEQAYETDRVIAILKNDMPDSDFKSAIKRGGKLEASKVFNTVLMTEQCGETQGI